VTPGQSRRRFNIVPFVHTPENPDPELEASLKAEWPTILQWMIDGCLNWQKNGLERPQSVVDATAEYFSDQDLIGQWLEADCIVDIGNKSRWETTGNLYKSWNKFATAAGEPAGTQKALAGKLQRHGLQRASKYADGRTQRVWTGLNFKIREMLPDY